MLYEAGPASRTATVATLIDTIPAFKKDFDAKGVAQSDHQIRRTMDELMEQAIAQIKAGKTREQVVAMTDGPVLLKPGDLRRVLGVSESHFYRLQQRGDLKRYEAAHPLGTRRYAAALVAHLGEGRLSPRRTV